jgi:hypothetical protein
MKRTLLLGILIGLTTLTWLSTASRAQDPADRLDHFRLIPRFSTLHTTGIEGPDQRYRLMGEYDFRRHFDEPMQAEFEQAEIWGSLISDLPTPAIVLDVDELLNLEGLKGEALPVLAPFDLYKFTGETSDGSSVELFAAMLRHWTYVAGQTEPPPGTSDFGMHRFRWLARSRPLADLNGDGVVDAADSVVFRAAEKIGLVAGSELDGTAGATSDHWREQFGEAIPDLAMIDAVIGDAAANAESSAAIPEPTALHIAVIACVLLVNGRYRGTPVFGDNSY